MSSSFVGIIGVNDDGGVTLKCELKEAAESIFGYVRMSHAPR